MYWKHTIYWLFGLCAWIACGTSNPVIQVDGIDIYQDEWTKTTHEITAKMRFEYDCDQPLEFVLIKKQFRYPSEVGVIGCDAKWIFSRSVDVMVAGPWKGRQTARTPQAELHPVDTEDYDTELENSTITGTDSAVSPDEDTTPTSDSNIDAPQAEAAPQPDTDSSPQ